jgi:hypothetical protein
MQCCKKFLGCRGTVFRIKTERPGDCLASAPESLRQQLAAANAPMQVRATGVA